MIKSLRVSLRDNVRIVAALFTFAILIGSLTAVWHIWDNDEAGRHQFYPYKRIVEQYAEQEKLPPELIAAVIRAESKFKPKVVSHRGAVGLMQLMPETARWIAGELGDKDYAESRLIEPEFNIRYGAWYLAVLLREFNGNVVLTAAAYNAGHGNVHEWMEEKGWGEDFNDVSKIPFYETRSYVEKVIKYQKEYARLYHKE